MELLSKAQAATFIEKAFRIRPGEGRLCALMFSYLLAIVSALIMSRTVRDTLFLRRVPIESLPLMYVAVAIAVAAASYMYSRVADQLRRDILVQRAMLIGALATFAFYICLRLNIAGDPLYTLLYIFVEIAGALSMIQFWTLASDVFSGRKGKRVYSFVGAGGVVANVICGFSIGVLSPKVGTEQLLLLVSLLYIICWLIVRRVAAFAHKELTSAIQRQSKRIPARVSKQQSTLYNSHLKLIAVMICLTFLTVTLIDYQFKIVARNTITGEAQLAAFFGYFYGISGVLACIMQFFVTGQLIERAGLTLSSLVLPSMLTLGMGLTLFVPAISTLTVLTITKSFETIFRYTIHDAASQLLYMPIPSDRRGRAKTFIDGILRPISIASAGILTFTLGYFMPANTVALSLLGVTVFLLIIWAVVVLRMKQAYVNSLLENLESKRLDLNEEWTIALNPQTVNMLRARLQSQDNITVLHTLELLPQIEIDLDHELESLLVDRPDEVRIAALKIIANRRRIENTLSIQSRLSDPSPSVRAQAIATYCALRQEKAIRDVSIYLEDNNLRVRSTTCASLIIHSGLDGVLTAAECLKSLLDSAAPAGRREGARVLGDVQVKSFFQPILKLLNDINQVVRVEAVIAAGKIRSPELVPPLIEKLADPACKQAATRALANYGSTIEHDLYLTLKSNHKKRDIQHQIPAILGLIGSESSLAILLEALDMEDTELRARSAREAARIKHKLPHVKTIDTTVKKAIEREAVNAYQTLAAIEDLRLDKQHLLREALEVRFERQLRVVLCLLEIRYPGQAIKLAHVHLNSSNRLARVHAIEVTENTLSREESRWVLPLLDDDVPRAEQVQRGRDLFGIIPCSVSYWVNRFLADENYWIVTCTLHWISTARIPGINQEVIRLTQHPNPVVRETACITLAHQKRNHLLPSTVNIADVARAIAQDPILEVRSAALLLFQPERSRLPSPG